MGTSGDSGRRLFVSVGNRNTMNWMVLFTFSYLSWTIKVHISPKVLFAGFIAQWFKLEKDVNLLNQTKKILRANIIIYSTWIGVVPCCSTETEPSESESFDWDGNSPDWRTSDQVGRPVQRYHLCWLIWWCSYNLCWILYVTDRESGEDDFPEERLDDHSEVGASVVATGLHQLIQYSLKKQTKEMNKSKRGTNAAVLSCSDAVFTW